MASSVCTLLRHADWHTHTHTQCVTALWFVSVTLARAVSLHRLCTARCLCGWKIEQGGGDGERTEVMTNKCPWGSNAIDRKPTLLSSVTSSKNPKSQFASTSQSLRPSNIHDTVFLPRTELHSAVFFINYIKSQSKVTTHRWVTFPFKWDTDLLKYNHVVGCDHVCTHTEWLIETWSRTQKPQTAFPPLAFPGGTIVGSWVAFFSPSVATSDNKEQNMGLFIYLVCSGDVKAARDGAVLSVWLDHQSVFTFPGDFTSALNIAWKRGLWGIQSANLIVDGVIFL